MLEIRKIVTIREITYSGTWRRGPRDPVVRAIGLYSVIHNPFAGKFVEDLPRRCSKPALSSAEG